MKNSILEISYDTASSKLSVELDLLALLILCTISIAIYLLIRAIRKKAANKTITEEVVPVEMSFKVGGASSKYKIIRNYQNIEIAHKLYIELVTRKAAIEIDEKYDVISEVYNSWYSLFQITRGELKNFTGDLLNGNSKSKELIRLATDILNEGLRPHLTEFQAEFRKWYNERLEEEKDKEVSERKSPQKIQKEYSDYANLISSMKDVNRILIDYADKLDDFLKNT